MKKRKNYGRKIKRSKINLYPKRKTRAQKILGTILLVIVILAVVFLGYCLGKPLLEFIEKNASSGSNDPAWIPPADTSQSEELPAETVTDETEASTEETTAPPMENPDIYAVSVPASALSNSASLSAFASKAAAEGYTAAVVTLKNSGGYLLYATETAPAADSEAVMGTMRASEIYDALSRNGLVPIAEMSVLADNMGGIINGGMCYKIVDEPTVSWLDYYSADEALRWSNPESEATAEYNGALAQELKNAGFILIQSDIIFPDFQNYDKEYIAAKYFSADRYKLLANVVAEGAALRVNAEDIILGNMNGTAEVLKNRSALTENTVIVTINRSAFTAEMGYPADAAALLEDVMSQCRVKCTGLTLVPMVESTGFSAEEIKAMKSAAEAMGCKDFYVK